MFLIMSVFTCEKIHQVGTVTDIMYRSCFTLLLFLWEFHVQFFFMDGPLPSVCQKFVLLLSSRNSLFTFKQKSNKYYFIIQVPGHGEFAVFGLQIIT